MRDSSRFLVVYPAATLLVVVVLLLAAPAFAAPLAVVVPLFGSGARVGAMPEGLVAVAMLWLLFGGVGVITVRLARRSFRPRWDDSIAVLAALGVVYLLVAPIVTIVRNVAV